MIIMIRITKIIILAICLTACNNRNPEHSDYDFAIPMIVPPADSALAGEYELDEFSYARVDKTDAYHKTAILLTIRTDSSFQVENLPDMVLSATGKEIKKQQLTATGSWSIPPVDTSQNNGFKPFRANIVFRFEGGVLFDTPVTLINQLLIRNDHPAISVPVGPPDTHQRLLFVKKDQ
jgi:hypothetical protein